jgi:hypothetical protein
VAGSGLPGSRHVLDLGGCRDTVVICALMTSQSAYFVQSLSPPPITTTFCDRNSLTAYASLAIHIAVMIVLPESDRDFA